MSLMQLFSGNPGNLGNPSNNIVKVKNDIESAIIVTCYTPKGNPVEVEAKDDEHAVWLKQMNPPQPEQPIANSSYRYQSTSRKTL